MVRRVILLLAALLFVPALAGAYEPYVGIHPEPVATPNLGAINIICPAHPTLYSMAITFIGKRTSSSDLSHGVSICVYCDAAGALDINDPSCKKNWYNMVELMGWFPEERTWSTPVIAGPCGPGESADSTQHITDNNPFTTQGDGQGCNTGPVMGP